MQLKLEVIKGPEKGKEFTLKEATTCVVGRGLDNCFSFSEEDPYISRRHFLLEVAPPNVYFKDLDVTNPSRINHRYVAEAKLKNDDVIEVGFTRLRVALDLEKRLESIHCRQCGTSISIYSDEDRNQLCDACKKKKWQQESKQISALEDTSRKAILCGCGKDVTKQANSDGRAFEFGGKVSYLCDSCHAKLEKESSAWINDYEVIRKLGEGGMGKVFLARHKPTARMVALKVINICNRQLGARFNREIRIMRELNHKNILCYIDTGQEKNNGKPYLAMEYASEGNLNDLLLEKGERLEADIATQYIIQTLRGLEYIHAKGVVHRDIKPENILLKDDEKDSLIPKITDFGLAKEFSKAGGTIMTKLGTAMGTHFYMPPEQINNAAGAREPADIYSMGVSLYYLLTGKYPFNFPSPLDVQRFLRENKTVKSPGEALIKLMEIHKLQTPQFIVMSEEPIPIRQQERSIPVSLAAVVDKAIRKDISRRHRSAVDFRLALEQATGSI